MAEFWFVHVDPDGKTACGSDHNKPCSVRSREARVNIARSMQKAHDGEVYLFPNSSWTQRFCEMDAAAQGALVRKIGLRLA